jgi:hypothetical protein
MTEITLPVEITDSDEEVTFRKYKQIQVEMRNEMGEEKFSRLMLNCGDDETIQQVFSDRPHTYKYPLIATGKFMSTANNPSWETVLWAQSFAMKYGQAHESSIREIVDEYEAEDFDLE